MFRGAPPNVGLDFDRRTGALAAIDPEGIGLGIKIDDRSRPCGDPTRMRARYVAAEAAYHCEFDTSD